MGATATPVMDAKNKSPAEIQEPKPQSQRRVIPAHRAPVMVDFPEVILPPTDLPYDDGVPLESNWHRAEISLLIESYQQYRHPERNFYAGGNMFIYFSSKQAVNRDFRGPDFFVVLNVDGDVDRKSWYVWEEEGRYPDVIIELMSESTANVDKTTKKDLYAQTFGTQNYFYYDPETQELTGFHLVDGKYIDLAANQQGHLWCEALKLWIGLWQGEYQGQIHRWIRFFDRGGDLVLTGKEAEKQRADLEKQRAEAEMKRAEAAQAEMDRLKTLLRERGIDPDSL